jgi:hypothetical protein
MYRADFAASLVLAGERLLVNHVLPELTQRLPSTRTETASAAGCQGDVWRFDPMGL